MITVLRKQKISRIKIQENNFMKTIIYFLLTLLLTITIAISSAFVFLYSEEDFSTLFLISIIISNVALLCLGILLIIKLFKKRFFIRAFIATFVVLFGIVFSLKISNWDGNTVTGFYSIVDKEKINDKYYVTLYYTDLDLYFKFQINEKEFAFTNVSDKKGHLLAFRYVKLNNSVFSNLDYISTQTTDISSEKDM